MKAEGRKTEKLDGLMFEVNFGFYNQEARKAGSRAAGAAFIGRERVV